jgi:hypothetical protein
MYAKSCIKSSLMSRDGWFAWNSFKSDNHGSKTVKAIISITFYVHVLCRAHNIKPQNVCLVFLKHSNLNKSLTVVSHTGYTMGNKLLKNFQLAFMDGLSSSNAQGIELLRYIFVSAVSMTFFISWKQHTDNILQFLRQIRKISETATT